MLASIKHGEVLPHFSQKILISLFAPCKHLQNLLICDTLAVIDNIEVPRKLQNISGKSTDCLNYESPNLSILNIAKKLKFQDLNVPNIAIVENVRINRLHSSTSFRLYAECETKIKAEACLL